MSTGKWEYKTYSLSWESGKTGWVSAYHYNQVSAKVYYWQQFQMAIMPELQKLLDERWQPVTEIGPAAIKLEYFKALDNPVSDTISNIFAILLICTIFLLPIGLPMIKTGSEKYQMIGFEVQLRRRSL